MTVTRRIYVSMPSDKPLSQVENALKWGIVEEIKKLGYQPEIFISAKSMVGLAAGRHGTWSEWILSLGAVSAA